jgi:hypothetical protein
MPRGYDREVRWTGSTADRRRAWGLAGLAVPALVVGLFGVPTAASVADTTTVSVTQGSLGVTASPDAQAGSPVTVTETGEVGVPSTLEVFAQLGRACDTTAAAEAAGGAIRVDQRAIVGTSAPFNLTSQFTPATAGTYYICAYLDGSSGGTSEEQSSSSVVVVAPAPPPPGPTPGPAPPPPPGPSVQPSTRECVVPALRRHSLAGARHLLAAAGCALGVTLEPSARGLRKERSAPGGKSLVLVVSSQFPAAGAKLRSNQYEAIRLVLGHRPQTPARRGRPAAPSHL